jgi:DNA-binding NarL/FixJ family response regulator
MIRVLVVDDHPMFRDGLRQLLDAAEDIEVAGEAGDGAEAVAYVRAHPVDLVVMDLNMPTMDGTTAIGEIRAVAPATRVLALSTYDTDEYVLPAMAAGAAGYLLKDASRTELLTAVRATARGEPVLSRRAADRVIGSLREPPEPEVLRPREVQLLELVAGGATNRQAADALFVSEATVKSYLLRIYRRLGARDRASAVAEGYRRGLLQ